MILCASAVLKREVVCVFVFGCAAKVQSAAAAAAKTIQCCSAFCDVVPREEGQSLNCGHFFCDSCWSGYLGSQVTHGRSCIFATCMGMKCTLNHPHKFGCACKELVPEAIVKKYVKDKNQIEKYDRYLNFVVCLLEAVPCFRLTEMLMSVVCVCALCSQLVARIIR